MSSPEQGTRRQLIDGTDHLHLADGYHVVWCVDNDGARHLWAIAPTEPGHFADAGFGSVKDAVHENDGPLHVFYQRQVAKAVGRIKQRAVRRCGDSGGVNARGEPCRTTLNTPGVRCHYHQELSR